jgi:hypothetical protein
MFPVYCTSCRAHIPKAISNLNQGLCPGCVANQAQAVAAAQQQAAHQAAAHQQAIYQTNTGLGACSRCGSPNLTDEIHTRDNSTRNVIQALGAMLGLVGLLFFCIGGFYITIFGAALFLASLFMPSKQNVGATRHCGYCGNQWPLAGPVWHHGFMSQRKLLGRCLLVIAVAGILIGLANTLFPPTSSDRTPKREFRSSNAEAEIPLEVRQKSERQAKEAEFQRIREQIAKENRAKEMLQEMEALKENPYWPDALAIDEAVNGEYSFKVRGRFYNGSGKSYDYIQISFDVFDSQGNKCGTAFDNLNRLGPGQTWSFTAHYFGSNGQGYNKTPEIRGR